MGASPWLAPAWRWWSAQPFGSLLWAWIRASFQRTAVSPPAHASLDTAAFMAGAASSRYTGPGAWLLCVRVLWSPDPAGEDGSRLAQQQRGRQRPLEEAGAPCR